MVPGVSEFVRMAKGVGEALTLIERIFWTDFPVESFNLNSVGVVPVVVGVPEIFPVDAANTSPSGNGGDPGAKLQV